MLKQHRTSNKGTRTPELAQGRATTAKKGSGEYRKDTIDRSKQQGKENKPRESRRERQQRGETQKLSSRGKTKEKK